MARNPKGGKKKSDSRPRPADGRGRVRRGHPKVCRFCAEHAVWVDYKDVDLLRRFIDDRVVDAATIGCQLGRRPPIQR
jgi:ribosomal protein S18